jgi:hypothetical protein
MDANSHVESPFRDSNRVVILPIGGGSLKGGQEWEMGRTQAY